MGVGGRLWVYTDEDDELAFREGEAAQEQVFAVRCWVKSRNERNPYCQLLTGEAEDSGGTAGDKPEEGGDDVKSSWPLCPGLHTCYNGRYRAMRSREALAKRKKPAVVRIEV